MTTLGVLNTYDDDDYPLRDLFILPQIKSRHSTQPLTPQHLRPLRETGTTRLDGGPVRQLGVGQVPRIAGEGMMGDAPQAIEDAFDPVARRAHGARDLDVGRRLGPVLQDVFLGRAGVVEGGHEHPGHDVVVRAAGYHALVALPFDQLRLALFPAPELLDAVADAFLVLGRVLGGDDEGPPVFLGTDGARFAEGTVERV